MTTRARETGSRRAAGASLTWGELATEQHGGRPLSVAWPWDPATSVTVTFLERGYLAGTVYREVEPATYDDEGRELEPAVTEPVERWVHVCDHPEWGRNSFELAAGHPVEVGE